MDSDPYRNATLHPPIPPLVRTPFMWGFRVWWGRSRVVTTSGATWNFTFDDTSGHRQYYNLLWTDKSIERVAMICEATPPGEPAALPYYDQQSHKESREAHANVEGVDFIQPAQVPTVARLARQAWESYQRSRANDPITR